MSPVLWQEAAVKDIHFRIFVVSPQGIRIQYYISYPQAMSFGTPTNLTVGNTTITPGVAASLSAQAVQAAMNQTVSLYGNSQASETTVSNYFLTRLKSIFENMIPGGRFRSNYYSQGVVPSTYDTNAFGTGDCD